MTHDSVDVQIHIRIIILCTKTDMSDQLHGLSALSRERALSINWMSESQSYADGKGKGRIYFPCWESNTHNSAVRLVASHHTNWTIPARLNSLPRAWGSVTNNDGLWFGWLDLLTLLLQLHLITINYNSSQSMAV
jgi:hypothetical protein